MKRLSPEKRNKLIGVAVGTLALMGLIYFFLIGPEQEQSRNMEGSVASARTKLEAIKKTIHDANANVGVVDATAANLGKAEEDVASGDLFAWTYDTMRRFKSAYRVELPDVGQPTLTDATFIPKSPYRQIRVRIHGYGYYHDIGKFLSEMENKFPHARVENLTMEPSDGADAAPEKLQFRADFIALVKPNS
jgi:Tfp pilus assembly protein PilO